MFLVINLLTNEASQAPYITSQVLYKFETGLANVYQFINGSFVEWAYEGSMAVKDAEVDKYIDCRVYKQDGKIYYVTSCGVIVKYIENDVIHQNPSIFSDITDNSNRNNWSFDYTYYEIMNDCTVKTF